MKPLNLFVIQPFKAKHSNLFLKLIKQVTQVTALFKNDFYVFRADEEPSNVGPLLQHRIDAYIKKADLCIADITGTRNDNVLLEVGAALTIGIPVILVASEQPPSDISNNLFIKCEIDKLDDQDVQKQFVKDLSGRLTEILFSVGLPKSPQFIVFGYKNRRAVDFYDFVRRSQKRICILTTNLGFVVTEPLSCGLCSEKLTLLEMIARQVSSKPSDFTIKILTLDPDSNYTNERASALLRDRQEFRDNMRTDLKTLKAFVESNDCTASVEVKTYDSFPLQMTYFFDNIIVSSVVNNYLSSRDCITYVHKLDESGSEPTYEQHFNIIWYNGTLHARSSKCAPRKTSWKTTQKPKIISENNEQATDNAENSRKSTLNKPKKIRGKSKN